MREKPLNPLITACTWLRPIVQIQCYCNTNPDQDYWYRYSGPLQLFQNHIPKNQIISKLHAISLLLLKYQVSKRKN